MNLKSEAIKNLPPLYFSLVMYTVCTHMLTTAVNIPWLQVIPSFFVYFALAAWFVTALNHVRSWAVR